LREYKRLETVIDYDFGKVGTGEEAHYDWQSSVGREEAGARFVSPGGETTSIGCN
jgi:hypothetical protein